MANARALLRRLMFAAALLAVLAALLSPVMLAGRGGRRALPPEAVLIAQRSDSWTPHPPCPLSRLPENRSCSPSR